MANQINPNDPYQPLAADRDRSNAGMHDPLRADKVAQADPGLREGPASIGRIAVFALGIAVVLGAVFYGLNGASNGPAGNGTTASQSAASQPETTQAKPPSPTNNIADSNPAKPVTAPGIRDVTPYNNGNNQPGVTTGAVPSRPEPPASAPRGSEIDRSKNGTGN